MSDSPEAVLASADYMALPQADRAQLAEHLSPKIAGFNSLSDADKAQFLTHAVQNGLGTEVKPPESSALSTKAASQAAPAAPAKPAKKSLEDILKPRGLAPSYQDPFNEQTPEQRAADSAIHPIETVKAWFKRPSAIPESQSGTEQLQGAGTAAVAGGAIGLALPEIAQKAGQSLSQFPNPYLKVGGKLLQVAGAEMRLHRTATAVNAALGATASAVIGQQLKERGASPAERVLGETVAGGMAPAAQEIAHAVSVGRRGVWALFTKAVDTEHPTITKAVLASKAKLAQLEQAGSSTHDLHVALAEGAKADVAAAHKAANDTIAKAHADFAAHQAQDPTSAMEIQQRALDHAQELIKGSEKRAKVLDEASGGKLATAKRVQALADHELNNTVGVPRLPSESGEELRSKVVGLEQEKLQVRDAAYQSTVAKRDAEVAAKEASGQFIDSAKGMPELKLELDTALLRTAKGQAAAKGMAQVTDPGTHNSYQRMFEAVTNKRAQVGIDAEGNPIYKTFKTSFGAIDQVRRQLGKVAFGKEAEGYDALGQQLAKKWYDKLSKVQQEYAGESQSILQSDYHEAMDGLKSINSRTGQKFTATDKINTEMYVKDAKELPSAFFKSKQSVKDLQELTGDSELVKSESEHHLARELQGKSAQQVRDYMSKPSNQDWISQIPGLADRGAKYAERVQRIEAVAQGRTKQATALAKQAEQTRSGGVADAERVKSRGEALIKEDINARSTERTGARDTSTEFAKAKQKEIEAAAAKVVTDQYPAEQIDRLLSKGTPSEHATAVRYIAASPGGKAALVKNIRRTLGEKSTSQRDMTEESGMWLGKLRPMLVNANLVSKEELAKLDADVAKVSKAYTPAEALKFRYRLLAAVAGGVAGDARRD
jgi:hypothetical protein